MEVAMIVFAVVTIATIVAVSYYAIRRDRGSENIAVGDVIALCPMKDATLEEKLAKGECAMPGCSWRATHQLPAIRHARSVLDPIWRSLGLVPVVRMQLVLERPISVPVTLCELHWHRARTLTEIEIAARSSSYAKWADSETRSCVDFQQRGLMPKLVEDAREQVKTRKRGSMQPAASVTELPLKKVSG